MESKEHKYNCEKCNYFTSTKQMYDRHLNTEKHKTGKRKTHSNKKYPEECEKCDYKPNSNRDYIQHKLIFHSTKEERKIGFKFYCDKCDFGTQISKVFDTHLNSNKHKKMSE